MWDLRRHESQTQMHTDGGHWSDSVMVVDNHDQIEALQARIQRTLGDELGVQQMQQQMLPVLFENHRAAVLCVHDYAESDYVVEMLRVMAAKYDLATPARLVLHQTQLVSLARQFHASTRHQAQGGGVFEAVHDWDQGELYGAFLALVQWGVQQKASDLHIHVLSEQRYADIRFTIDGRYVRPAHLQGMSTSMVTAMLSVVWMNIEGGNGAVFDPHAEQQGSLQCQINSQQVVLRWASLAADTGPSVCLRILVRGDDAPIPCISALGYSPAQQLEIDQAMLADGGAILFSGVVGSGKSTSLAALVAALPPWRKVITVEDPVEQRIPHAVQNSLSRNLSIEAHQDFASKLRALKRSAMTDVLLGEIRDHETGRAFSDLASSGVRVYSTVHAASAALIPQRLASDFIGVSRQLMAAPGILRLLIHQLLVSTLCQSCAIPMLSLTTYPSWLPLRAGQRPTLQAWMADFERAGGDPHANYVRNMEGCAHCRRESVPELNGYAGRTVVAEILNPQTNQEWLRSIEMFGGGRLNSPNFHGTPLNAALTYESGSLSSVGLQKCNVGLIDAFDLEHRIGGWWQHA
ncbi:MAG TPA: ATPase, T2SS/T4P/T4SS family [Paenalcaligenes sp.]|nr:ATPase, T2SS/T4P/T4SS family [Paenalcaligenes sp.]